MKAENQPISRQAAKREAHRIAAGLVNEYLHGEEFLNWPPADRPRIIEALVGVYTMLERKAGWPDVQDEAVTGRRVPGGAR